MKRVNALNLEPTRSSKDIFNPNLGAFPQWTSPNGPATINVIVQTALTGQSLGEFSVSSDASVVELQNIVYPNLPLHAKFLYTGNVLSTSDRLCDIGIRDGAQLQSVISRPSAVCIAGLPKVSEGEFDLLCEALSQMPSLCSGIGPFPPFVPMSTDSDTTDGLAIVSFTDESAARRAVHSLHRSLMLYGGNHYILHAVSMDRIDMMDDAKISEHKKHVDAWRAKASGKLREFEEKITGGFGDRVNDVAAGTPVAGKKTE